MHREFSSGGVVFKKLQTSKKTKLKTLWLVTKSAKDPSGKFKQVWRLPKGWIDNEKDDIPGPMASGKIKADEKSLQSAALREVLEEGGIKAKIIKKITTTKYFFTHPTRGSILKFVTFYLMEWVKDLPEGHDDETEEVAWLEYKDAYKTLSLSGEKKILKQAKELLV